MARFPIPWGLLAALGGYFALVTGYVAYTYWTSPEYQASQESAAGWQVLGRDEGRHCSREELLDAYRHLLRAAQAMPRQRELHEDLQTVTERLDEKHWKLPREMRLAADAQSALYAQLEKEREPTFAVGTRERGWDPQSLLAGPARTFAWSLAGGGVLVILWAYLRYSARRVRHEEREEQLQRLEREVAERGAQRRNS